MNTTEVMLRGKFVAPANYLFFLVAVFSSYPASTAVLSFAGEIDSITVDSGQSVFSGAASSQSLEGGVDIDALSGNVRMNNTSVGGLSCCVLASGDMRIDDQLINSQTADFYNDLLDEIAFAPGDVVDIIDVELDRILNDQSRLELRVLFVLTNTVFDQDLSYDLNTDDVLISVMTVTEYINEDVVFSAFGAVFYDLEGDGVPDHQDNCTFVPNPEQIDTDGDGIGNRCDADLDNNCIVNFLDFAFYPPAFNSVIGSPNYNPDVDFNSSGFIEFLDLVLLQTSMFSPPGPSNVACE